MTEKQVITRFAPSPTGALHVGGARTALFAWAYARRHGGQFILRMEDTDQARSTAASTKGILADLQWLGLDWDQGPRADVDDPYALEGQMGNVGPYFQSQRLEIYGEYIQRLLDEGRAYKCFKTAEQLNAERAKAREEKRDYQYDPTESMALTAEQVATKEAAGESYVVRFHMGDDVAFDDAVYGRIEVKAAELEDFVIQKGDGFPTFHMAVIIDDALMGVTHVIRGQEHLYNTTKHVALQDALGFERPTYAHTPSIMNIDGSKMSKRDKAKVARQAAKAAKMERPSEVDEKLWKEFLKKKNDEMDIAQAIAAELDLALPEIEVADFERSGYLPQVILNYIALLGWSPGNDIERFDADFIRSEFSLERINKSNAKFDREKLAAFSGDTLQQMDTHAFTGCLKNHLEKYDKSVLEKLGDKFDLFAANYQPRSRTFEDPAEQGKFFLVDDEVIEFDAKAVKKVMRKNDDAGISTLREIGESLQACEDWTVGGLETLIKEFTAAREIGMGMVAQPLRVAVSGSTVSPPIYDTLVILGKDVTLRRIERCLEELS